LNKSGIKVNEEMVHVILGVFFFSLYIQLFLILNLIILGHDINPLEYIKYAKIETDLALLGDLCVLDIGPELSMLGGCIVTVMSFIDNINLNCVIDYNNIINNINLNCVIDCVKKINNINLNCVIDYINENKEYLCNLIFNSNFKLNLRTLIDLDVKENLINLIDDVSDILHLTRGAKKPLARKVVIRRNRTRKVENKGRLTQGKVNKIPWLFGNSEEKNKKIARWTKKLPGPEKIVIVEGIEAKHDDEVEVPIIRMYHPYAIDKKGRLQKKTYNAWCLWSSTNNCVW